MVIKLYVYSYPSRVKDSVYKVGQTQGDVDERIRRQQGTSNSEAYKIYLIEELPQGIEDRHVHREIEQLGGERQTEGAGREWFKTSLDQIKQAVNKIKYGVARRDAYPPRKEQTAAITKALQWFREEYQDHIIDGASHKSRFLLNAKMRFGKCFTGLKIAEAIESMNTLIVTYKPEVISEWMDSLNNHVDFEGWTAVRAKKIRDGNDLHIEDSGKIPDHSGPLVVCASLQDLAFEADGSIKARLRNIPQTNWDLVIFDEVHYGSRTDRAKFIIGEIDANKRLDLSGTPFRLLEFDDFCPEQVFTYSYLDEQQNKEEEIQEAKIHPKTPSIYREMPDLDISTIEITEQDIKEQTDSFLTDDLDFSLNELFRVSKGKFLHEDAVNHFIEGLCNNMHDARSISVFGSLGRKLETPATRHTVWWLSRVDSVKALSKLLKNHHYFKDFEIINAAGQSDKQEISDEDIVRDKNQITQKIKKSIQNNKKGTITLTVRRFLTGITIPEWESILVLNDVKSAESYFQAIFRVQSRWVTEGQIQKPKAWVFDFAISRCLRTTFEYADALADQLDLADNSSGNLNENIDKVVNGLCDRLDIKRFYEGKLVADKTVAKDVFEALNYSGSRIALAKRITSDALLDFVSLSFLEENPDLFDALKRIKGYRTQDVGDIGDFVKIGKEAKELASKKSSPQSEEELEEQNEDFVENEKEKEKKTRKKWVATQIKRLAICMADFIYMTKFREHKIDHVIKTKDSEFFEVVTGITQEEFQKFCELGFINKNALNRIVNEFRRQEDTSLKLEDFVKNYLESDAEEDVA